MKQSYTVIGMICNGYRTSIENWIYPSIELALVVKYKTALKRPMIKATFIENSIMIVMAIAMLIKIYN